MDASSILDAPTLSELFYNKSMEDEIADLNEKLEALKAHAEDVAWEIRCIENRIDLLENQFEE